MRSRMNIVEWFREINLDKKNHENSVRPFSSEVPLFFFKEPSWFPNSQNGNIYFFSLGFFSSFGEFGNCWCLGNKKKDRGGSQILVILWTSMFGNQAVPRITCEAPPYGTARLIIFQWKYTCTYTSRQDIRKNNSEETERPIMKGILKANFKTYS